MFFSQLKKTPQFYKCTEISGTKHTEAEHLKEPAAHQ